MKIRPAQTSDKQDWANMRYRLWPDSIDVHLDEIEEYFNGESIDIVQAYVVEDEDGSLVGFMELNIRNFAEGSRSPRLPYLEAWYVEEAYRGNGYGKKLMLMAENWAIDKGYSELASDTNIENETSIAMHKSLGFKETERIITFLKKLR
ncbi:MAG: GNAT family N-acetyltransferase [Arenicellales bacterium]|nr:GNAT family N-acetyltransferase [Arenicellales bacterium]